MTSNGSLATHESHGRATGTADRCNHNRGPANKRPLIMLVIGGSDAAPFGWYFMPTIAAEGATTALLPLHSRREEYGSRKRSALDLDGRAYPDVPFGPSTTALFLSSLLPFFRI